MKLLAEQSMNMVILLVQDYIWGFAAVVLYWQ